MASKRSIAVTIAGSSGDYTATFANTTIGKDGEHLNTKLVITIPTDWIAGNCDAYSYMTVEYKNAKGKSGSSVNNALPVSVATAIEYEVPRDAMYAPETIFSFNIYEPVSVTEFRIIKTAQAQVYVDNSFTRGSVTEPFGHDTIQAIWDAISALIIIGGTPTANPDALGNVRIGLLALEDNISGADNVAICNSTLSDNTTGHDNIAVGKQSLFFNISGYGNIAIGRETLLVNTTGYRNIAIGAFSLYGNIGGHDNLVMGSSAMSFNTSGSNNVALGNNSLYSSVSGDNNVAMGDFALYKNIGGHLNIAIGTGALYDNLEGDYNVVVGADAFQHSVGVGNVGIGWSIGTAIINGTNNVFIGHSAGILGGGQADVSNSIVIGANAYSGADNTTIIGNTSTLSTWLEGRLTSAKGYKEVVLSPTGVNRALDTTASNIFKLITFTAETTLTFATPGSGTDCYSMTLFITQGATPQIINLPTIKWAGAETPDLSTASKTYILTITTIDNGTTWFGFDGGIFT